VLPLLVPKGVNLTFEVYGSIAALALLLIIATGGKLSYKRTPDLEPVRDAK
jgi:hypothetical protein